MFTYERDILFGRNIEVFTPRVDRINHRDSVETALRIARARSVTWVDRTGRREPWNAILISGARTRRRRPVRATGPQTTS